MRTALGGTIYIMMGALAGLVSAVVAVDSIGSKNVNGDGPWQWREAVSNSGGSFYATAHYLLSGRLPPAPGQIQEMTAESDSSGQPLEPGCSYTVTGRPGGLVWWSLAAATRGRILPSVSGLMTSDKAVLESDGSLVVVMSEVPQPGNWIKPSDKPGPVLMFTGASGGTLGQRDVLPNLKITRSGC